MKKNKYIITDEKLDPEHMRIDNIHTRRYNEIMQKLLEAYQKEAKVEKNK